MFRRAPRVHRSLAGPPRRDHLPDIIPSTASIQNVNLGDQVSFTVPFRADDGGELMQAVFVEDFNPNNSVTAFAQRNVASTKVPFADQVGQAARVVQLPWTAGPVGCLHTVTMVLSRTSNFTYFVVPQTADESSTARVTWFFNILEQGISCPVTVDDAGVSP